MKDDYSDVIFSTGIMCFNTNNQAYKDWKSEDQKRKEAKDKAKEIEWITFSDRVKKSLHKKIMGRKK